MNRTIKDATVKRFYYQTTSSDGFFVHARNKPGVEAEKRAWSGNYISKAAFWPSELWKN